jgi:hypothetical protein
MPVPFTLEPDGSVTFNTSSLASGYHQISAFYSGDGHFNSSTTTQLIQLVHSPLFLPLILNSLASLSSLPAVFSSLFGIPALYQLF